MACVLALEAQTLAPLARAYRDSPTPARRDAVLRFASEHPADSGGALALLAVGVTEIERGESEAGARHLTSAAERLPQLKDYVAFYAGKAHLALKELDAAIESFGSVLAMSPASPLLGGSAVLAAEAYLASGAPHKAAAVLKEHDSKLPQPEGNFGLASAYEAAGELALAAAYHQRVYYGYPASKQAGEAAEALRRLRETLGPAYPPPLPGPMLDRAGKWLAAGNYGRAWSEYESLASWLAGPERELAQVRALEARRRRGGAQRAYPALRSLNLGFPEADAERLYYLVQCARSLEDTQAMMEHVSRLNLLYPASSWRLNALIWAGNYYLLRNETESYVPLYQACYESFAGESQAEYCHWKVAWAAYIQRRDGAAELLREHLKRFPESDKRPAALYFLGRLSEQSGAREEAQLSFRKILESYPNNYYAPLASERLGGATAPAPASHLDFVPSAESRNRIIRSRLLSSAGLHELADGELLFATGENGQRHVLAAESAREAVRRGAVDEAVRRIKSFFPAYLSTPLEPSTAEMWRLAFPVPYRPQLEKHAKAHKLDIYLMAGLIRQESEFNPNAVSRANARGLMQILPSTGRLLAKTLKLGPFRTGLLFRPDYNIRLGAFHLRSLVDGLDGSLEAALASYNGGQNRVALWRTWASYQEPAEFVETIPFTETRTYVQAVLRNAWMYRRIYGPGSPAREKNTGQQALSF